MNRETQCFVRSLPCHNLDGVEISGRAWGDQSYGFRSYGSLSYPEYDTCEAPYPSPGGVFASRGTIVDGSTRAMEEWETLAGAEELGARPGL